MGLPVFLAYISDKTRGSLSGILAVAAISAPVLFAAVRDITVGTDVLTYGIWTYRTAASQDLFSFMVGQVAEAAPGYNLIAWISSHLGSFEIYLGTLQALTVAPVYCYARKRYPGCSWPAMAAYMLLLFPISLNAMKQMIAVALCLPAFDFVEDKKPAKFLVWILLVSALIHQTAIVFLVLYPVMRLLLDSKNPRLAFFGQGQRFVSLLIVVGLFLVAFTGGSYFIDVLSGLKESYSFQANASGTRLNYSALAMIVFFAFSYMVGRLSAGEDISKKAVNEPELLCAICLVAFAAVQMNMIASSMERFAYYFMSFVPLYVSCLMSCDARRSNRILAWSCLVILIVYFYVTCVVNGGNQVFPYTSAILGIS